MGLQSQFIERRNSIKQSLSNQNQQIISSNANNQREKKQMFIKEEDDLNKYNATFQINAQQEERNISKRRSKRLKNKMPKNEKQRRNKNQRKRMQANPRKTSNKRGKKHKCPHCEYSSNDSSNFGRHMRTHTGEKPFVCSYGNCKKRFSVKASLKDHINAHLGIKNHKCSYCGKAFVQKGNLKTHIRTHTGEKPFECKHCKKRFTQRSSMNGHIKSMHK